jgi:hypothetical protein
MTGNDRQRRWNERYRNATGEVGPPSALLKSFVDKAGLPPGGGFDLIAVIRYLNLELLREAAARLNPGGYLVVEVHLATADTSVAGPRNPDFRAPPGAVGQACAGLETIHCEEGPFADGDRREALVRYIGRAPGVRAAG